MFKKTLTKENFSKDFYNKIRQKLKKDLIRSNKLDQKDESICIELADDILDLLQLSEREIPYIITALTIIMLECCKSMGMKEETLIDNIKDYYGEK